MTTATAESVEARFRAASERLYRAVRECFGDNFAANQPIIRAISEYGYACRRGADIHDASEHVYAVLRHRLGANFAANQPIIRALAEYGQACRQLGERGA